MKKRSALLVFIPIVSMMAGALAGCEKIDSSFSSSSSSSPSSSSSSDTCSDSPKQIDSFTRPTFVEDWENAKKESSPFSYDSTSDDFTVGDINAFKFLPFMMNFSDCSTPVRVKSYHSISQLLIADSSGDFAPIEGTVADYCAVDEYLSTYDFTAKAIGHKFRLSVRPAADVETGGKTFEPITFDFAVAAGYNVYDGSGLLALASSNDAEEAYELDVLRDQLHMDNNVIRGCAGLYFMNNIVLSRSDFPSYCFWTEDELIKRFGNGHDYTAPFIKSVNADDSEIQYLPSTVTHSGFYSDTANPDRVCFVGSLKNNTSLIEWHPVDGYATNIRDITIDGNYFSLDASTDSSFRTLVNADGGLAQDGIDKAFSEGITSSTAVYSCSELFTSEDDISASDRFNLYHVNAPKLEDCVKPERAETIKNLTAKGNASRSNDPTLMGGLIFYKPFAYNVVTVSNVLMTGWFSGVVSEYYSFRTFTHCKMSDNFNTFIYVDGGQVSIDHCILSGAGGPAIFGQLRYPGIPSKSSSDPANSYLPRITMTDSSVTNYLAGSEGWFHINNASNAADSLKVALQLPNSDCDASHQWTATRSGAQMMNIVAVFVNAYSMMDFPPIIGSYMKIDDGTAFDFVDNPTIAALNANANGAPWFQSTGSTVAGVHSDGNYGFYNPNVSSNQLLKFDSSAADGVSAITPYAYTQKNYFDGSYLNAYIPSLTHTTGYLGLVLGAAFPNA